MPEIWTILTPVLRLAFYPAVLLAIGGVAFTAVMARHLPAVTRAYTGRVTGRAALAGFVIAALQVPVAAGNLGGDLASMTDGMMLTLVLETPTGSAAMAAMAGFLLVLTVERRRLVPQNPARLAGPVLVIMSLTLSGHATTGGVVTAALLAVHLAALGFWMGALLPLRAMSRHPEVHGGLQGLADVAEAFGRIAGWFVAVLVVAGVAYAALLLGSVSALLTTSYGNLLLVKVAFVSGLLGFAALNRWRLVPDIQEGRDRAADRLATSIGWEALVVLGILFATALMTSSVPLPA